VCQIANYLRSVGVKRGDDVTIYMPMIPELPAAMARRTRAPWGPEGAAACPGPCCGRRGQVAGPVVALIREQVLARDAKHDVVSMPPACLQATSILSSAPMRASRRHVDACARVVALAL